MLGSAAGQSEGAGQAVPREVTQDTFLELIPKYEQNRPNPTLWIVINHPQEIKSKPAGTKFISYGIILT